jgi:hypothetical protein
MGLPGIRVRGQPSVKRRLRLFQQGEARQTGLFRRRHRELARHFVEGRRHGEDEVLLRQRG